MEHGKALKLIINEQKYPQEADKTQTDPRFLSLGIWGKEARVMDSTTVHRSGDGRALSETTDCQPRKRGGQKGKKKKKE